MTLALIFEDGNYFNYGTKMTKKLMSDTQFGKTFHITCRCHGHFSMHAIRVHEIIKPIPCAIFNYISAIDLYLKCTDKDIREGSENDITKLDFQHTEVQVGWKTPWWCIRLVVRIPVYINIYIFSFSSWWYFRYYVPAYWLKQRGKTALNSHIPRHDWFACHLYGKMNIHLNALSL